MPRRRPIHTHTHIRGRTHLLHAAAHFFPPHAARTHRTSPATHCQQQLPAPTAPPYYLRIPHGRTYRQRHLPFTHTPAPAPRYAATTIRQYPVQTTDDTEHLPRHHAPSYYRPTPRTYPFITATCLLRGTTPYTAPHHPAYRTARTCRNLHGAHAPPPIPHPTWLRTRERRSRGFRVMFSACCATLCSPPATTALSLLRACL